MVEETSNLPKFTIPAPSIKLTSLFGSHLIFEYSRAAKTAGIGGLDPSITKDIIDSEDPKHTLFDRFELKEMML